MSVKNNEAAICTFHLYFFTFDVSFMLLLFLVNSTVPPFSVLAHLSTIHPCRALLATR